MPRFLLQAHGPTDGLAHLGTALAVSGELRRRGHTVGIAYGGSRGELIEAAGLPWHRVLEVPPEREWRPREWFRSAEELAPAVDSHLEAISAFEPDAVIACHGVPGRVAAEIAGLPLLHVYHYLHTTRYARSVSLAGDRLADLVRPRRALRVGRARVRRLRERGGGPLLDAVAALRTSRGLPPAGPGAIAGCPDSLVAAATAPFIVPARGVPAHWRYVGPVPWSAPAPAPDPPRGGGPLAYVTQGSTGEPRLLRRSVSELAGGGFRVVATTANLVDPGQLDGAATVAARLLDGAACMRLADVAVIHGGQQTLLEAIRSGTPVVALPSRADQIGHLHRIEQLGIGRGLYPPPLLAGAIRRAARRALQPAVGGRCTALAERLERGWNGTGNVASLAEALVAGAEPSRRGAG